MKIFIVFKGYWLTDLTVYKVFINENKAIECRDELLKKRDVRSYILSYNLEDMKVYRLYTWDDPYCGDITEGIVATEEEAIEICNKYNEGKNPNLECDKLYCEEVKVETKEEFIKKFFNEF